jgi:hypothetical protein
VFSRVILRANGGELEAKDFVKGVRNEAASDVANGMVGMTISGMAMFPFLLDVLSYA